MPHAVTDPLHSKIGASSAAPAAVRPATPAPPPQLRADLVPSIEGCCEDSCCYLDWVTRRGASGD